MIYWRFSVDFPTSHLFSRKGEKTPQLINDPYESSWNRIIITLNLVISRSRKFHNNLFPTVYTPASASSGFLTAATRFRF